MNKSKILIVDDQKIVREGIRLLLGQYQDLEVVGEGTNGFDAINQCRKLCPDLILMDLRMPEMNGIDSLIHILKENSKVKILILTTFNEQDLIYKALEHGASGYILKDIGSKEMYESIKTVLQGKIMLQAEVTSEFVKKVVPRYQEPCKDKENLSKKEMEVAKQIALGGSNKQIASLMGITEGTVKNHVSNILSKWQLVNRTHIALHYNKYHD